ncbi:MAG: hypothetical protein A3I75_03910 [Deltaproteobacteria bacterium RIFCSPLOWO2_02_FULL_50_16]|nr:MAG: hypothetical protein A3I75_03910 [Deltaproteobacteria bacterium RIFCSPLOWO2_02_FULL_50_16]
MNIKSQIRPLIAILTLSLILFSIPLFAKVAGTKCQGIQVDDNNPCTNDKCLDGKVYHTNNFNPCNDNNGCTINDICKNGRCEGTLTKKCPVGTKCNIRGVCQAQTKNPAPAPNNSSSSLQDQCPLDPNKTAPGICGCGKSDLNKDCSEDLIAPRLTFVFPMSGMQEVPLNSIFVFVFTEEMDPSIFSEIKVSQGSTPVLGEMSFLGKVARFKPNSPLSPNTKFTVTVTPLVKDLAGNPLEKEVSWSFTTGAVNDMSLPLIKSAVPSNLEGNVPLNRAVLIEFNKVIDPASVNANNFVLEGSGTPIPGTVGYAGNMILFRPLIPLTPNSSYQFKMANAVLDVFGNALNLGKDINFTTGTATENTALGVGLMASNAGQLPDPSQPIDVMRSFNNFCDPLLANSMNYSMSKLILKGDGSKVEKPVPGIVTFIIAPFSAWVLGKSILHFQPFGLLEPNTEYKMVVSTQLTSLSGLPLAGLVEWTFKTKKGLNDPIILENLDPPPESLSLPEHQKLRDFVQWMRDRGYPENIVSKWVLDYMNPLFHSLLKSEINFGSPFYPPLKIRFVDLIPTDPGSEPSPIDVAETEELFRTTFGMTVKIVYQQYPVNYEQSFGAFLTGTCQDNYYYGTEPYDCLFYKDGDANMGSSWIKQHWNEILAAEPTFPTTHSLVRAAIAEINGVPTKPNLSAALGGYEYACIDSDVPSLEAPLKSFGTTAHEWGHTWGRGHSATSNYIPFGTWGLLSYSCNPKEKRSGDLPLMPNPLEAYKLEPKGGFEFPELILGEAYFEKLKSYPACEIPFSLTPDPKLALSYNVNTIENTVVVNSKNTGNIPLSFVPIQVDLTACGSGVLEQTLNWINVGDEKSSSFPVNIPLQGCLDKIEIDLGINSIGKIE